MMEKIKVLVAVIIRLTAMFIRILKDKLIGSCRMPEDGEELLNQPKSFSLM
jgi:hypothetical protein